MNKVQLMGRLTKDPELKATAQGKSYVNITVACDNGKDKDGNKLTNFIPCSAWDKRAETIAKYFTKGQKILVSAGTLMVRNYKDLRSGENRTYTYVNIDEFEFVEGKTSNNSGGAPGSFDSMGTVEVPF